jgi:dienelactone hydrolase
MRTWIAMAALAAAGCFRIDFPTACSEDPSRCRSDGAVDATADGSGEADVAEVPPDAPDAEAGLDVGMEAATDADADPIPTHGCPGDVLLPNPDDFGARGPWPVGVRTVSVAGLTVDVWYPARRGSEAGKSRRVTNLYLLIPESFRAPFGPPPTPPLQTCDCFANLPIDDAHGPYPIVLYAHGVGGFRSNNESLLTHWASRGFVVLAANHAAQTLTSLWAGTSGGSNVQFDLELIRSRLFALDGELQFLAGHADSTRLALAGHAAGASGAAGVTQSANVHLLLAGGSLVPSAIPASALFVGADRDEVVTSSQIRDRYLAASPQRRLVVLANAGHHSVTDVCTLRLTGGDLLGTARAVGMSVPPGIAFTYENGCTDDLAAHSAITRLVRRATSATLEETLRCRPAAAANLRALASTPGVSTYDEQL